MSYYSGRIHQIRLRASSTEPAFKVWCTPSRRPRIRRTLPSTPNDRIACRECETKFERREKALSICKTYIKYFPYTGKKIEGRLSQLYQSRMNPDGLHWLAQRSDGQAERSAGRLTIVSLHAHIFHQKMKSKPLESYEWSL